MKKFVTGIALLFWLTGCEKNINFNLDNADDVLVVDASIENGKAPVVVLTKSLDYYSNINAVVLANTFIHNATVTINNGTGTQQLKEYTVPFIPGINYYYYSTDSSNLAAAFNGTFNTGYDLNIKSAGKEYTAHTTIPVLAKYPDSIWWKKAPLNPDTNTAVLMVRTFDPPGLGNYIRYFTKKNSGQFLPGENSVFDDKIIDGTTYTVQVDPGVDRNNHVSYDSNYFKRGDTVTLKICNIDKATFTFWNTWEFAYQSIGNPFSQPGKVIGNISNGALGAFYGYAAWYKTIIIR
ncbi:MAG: DUF4249 family protein [Ferruginibacter sp.]